jgi:hypothetical protein
MTPGYEYEHSLRNRIAKSVIEADAGHAVIVKISEDERAEAKRLVGNSPVIIGTAAECTGFLAEWMAPFFQAKRAPINNRVSKHK